MGTPDARRFPHRTCTTPSGYDASGSAARADWSDAVADPGQGVGPGAEVL
jgi:hypothetical protein